MATSAEVESLIRAAIPDAQVEVRSEDNVHFLATVISPEFEGRPTLARHRMVYAALGDAVGGDIHALSLRTMTPSEAEK